jgi:hypothetical protein
LAARVARWFIFRPKIPILSHFCRPRNGKCGSILWTFGTFKSSWYILWQFWYIFSHFGKFELEKSGNPGLVWTLLFLWRKKTISTTKSAPHSCSWIFSFELETVEIHKTADFFSAWQAILFTWKFCQHFCKNSF